MGRYRKVEVATWTDERIKRLSAPQPNGQTLWHYLLFGPRTTMFPGLVVAREAVMADDLGWPVEAFREAFREAFGEGLVEADWKAGLVVLRKALIDSFGEPRETSKPESPNVLKGWAKAWIEIPECDLKRQYLRRLESFAEALGEGYMQAFREGFRKALAQPSPNQDTGDRRQERRDSETATRLVLVPPNQGSKTPKHEAPKRARKAKSKPTDPTPHEHAIAQVVLEKLGARNGIRYAISKPHVKLIVDRLREGIGEVDLRAVIGYCAVELGWATDERMRTYLRPETLFGKESIHKYLEPAKAWAADQKPILPTLPPDVAAAIAEAP